MAVDTDSESWILIKSSLYLPYELTLIMNYLQLSTIFIIISSSVALKCRSDDGPSDGDLKRIARSCMRKVSENIGRYNQNQSQGDNSYNNNGDWGNYDEYNRDHDRSRQGNRDRLHMRTGRSKRSGNDRRYDLTSSGGRNSNQNQRPNGNHHGNNGGNNSSSYNNDRQSKDMQRDQDSACVVHCFFEELNMLNNDDYPDKHKVNYILTKDIRDREIRSFYADAIQECFHYLELQRRKDKCQFSRELINCMMEFAQVNCEDWQDHTLIFS